MAGDNGQEGDIVKWCPFLNEYCIKERCAIHTGVTKSIGGLQQKAALCGFNAMSMILSQINARTAPPQPQKIELPGGLRQFRG